ncbi:MAG: glycosyltransferase family 2 protein, partial [Firmicutes bacterium]|nr:glycosyltransferase family 2 protein [Bacillota bacterium]
MLLSACMIVKDEELTLGKCLDSLRGVVDEVIVLDTGSTDATVRIATEWGAQVHTFAWCNDFSAARNASMAYASGDFILIIDADEYLDATEKLSLRHLLETAPAEAYAVNIRNYTGPMHALSQTIPVTVIRIFRRGHLFVQAIHEQIVLSVLATGRPIAHANLTIHHLGYLHEFVHSRNKTVRNMQLLEQELSARPDDLFQRSNLLAEYMRSGHYEACANLSSELMDELEQTPVSQWPPYAARIALFLVSSLWEIGRREEALRRAPELIEYFPQLAYLKNRYAVMLIQSERLLEALPLLHQCRLLGDPRDAYIDAPEGVGTYLAASGLAYTWMRLGDPLTARHWYLTALYEGPHQENLLFPLIGLLPEKDSEVLVTKLEPLLASESAFASFVEICAICGIGGHDGRLGRARARMRPNDVLLRAELADLVRRMNDESAVTEHVRDVVERHASEGGWLMYAIHCAEHRLADEFNAAIARSGERGTLLVAALARVNDKAAAPLPISSLLRDAVAMRARVVLVALLKVSGDLEESWNYVAATPLADALLQIEWPGTNAQQCVMNARRALAAGNATRAREWARRARAFEPTVATILLEADLALADSDVAQAGTLVRMGLALLPESELLQAAERQIQLVGGDRDMNPGELYKKQFAWTAPL